MAYKGIGVVFQGIAGQELKAQKKTLRKQFIAKQNVAHLMTEQFEAVQKLLETLARSKRESDRELLAETLSNDEALYIYSLNHLRTGHEGFFKLASLLNALSYKQQTLVFSDKKAITGVSAEGRLSVIADFINKMPQDVLADWADYSRVAGELKVKGIDLKHPPVFVQAGPQALPA